MFPRKHWFLFTFRFLMIYSTLDNERSQEDLRIQ